MCSGIPSGTSFPVAFACVVGVEDDVARLLVPALFSVGGEALKAAVTPDGVGAMLASRWGVSYDDSSLDWKAIAGSEAVLSSAFESERLVVATRKA